MNKEEALKYVYKILAEYYHSSHDGEAGILLSELDTFYILAKGAKTSDPAAWHDWEKAVKKITSGEGLNEEEANKAFIALMEEYDNHHGFYLKKAIEYFKQEGIQNK